LFKYAYPIYDLSRCENVSIILDFLKHYEIYSIGRFGSWEYLSMEVFYVEEISHEDISK